MPIFQIDTNLPNTAVPLEFRKKTCEIMSDIFKSPIQVR